MGFFSDLDVAIMEACSQTTSDDAVVSMIRQQYNGLVTESTIRESIDAIRMGDYDWSPYDNAY
jgi:hypothetical protein